MTNGPESGEAIDTSETKPLMGTPESAKYWLPRIEELTGQKLLTAEDRERIKSEHSEWYENDADEPTGN